jgi:Branched-chain amino acid transport system / permease component
MKWIAAALLAVVLILLPSFAGDFYINLASQILIAAIFALSLNLLVGYGGMTSLGHASYLGVAAYISALLTSRYGFGHGPAAIISIAGTIATAAFFGVIALRATGLGFLMITLALSQVLWARLSHVPCHQRRQWNSRPDPADAVWHFARQRGGVLLVRADRGITGVSDDGDLRILVLRIVVEGRARPATPHGGTRLQSLDDPVDHLYLRRLLGRRIRIALRLLQ